MSFIEDIREKLFDKDNHSLETIDDIEIQLIKYLERDDISPSERDLASVTRKQARKKYLYWKYTPKHCHVSPIVQKIIKGKMEDVAKDPGLLS